MARAPRERSSLRCVEANAMTGCTLRNRVFLRPPINKGAMPGRVEVCATCLRIISRPQPILRYAADCALHKSCSSLLLSGSKTRWMRETAVSVVQEAVRPGRAEQGYDGRVKSNSIFIPSVDPVRAVSLAAVVTSREVGPAATKRWTRFRASLSHSESPHGGVVFCISALRRMLLPATSFILRSQVL